MVLFSLASLFFFTKLAVKLQKIFKITRYPVNRAAYKSVKLRRICNCSDFLTLNAVRRLSPNDCIAVLFGFYHQCFPFFQIRM